jgi:4-alpha-glucanotransferase
MSGASRETERLAGVLVPLPAIPSAASWGIGEFGDVPILGKWLLGSGQRLLQLLPINEMSPDEVSPYAALSAMALDPQFIVLRDLEDWAACGGDGALDAEQRERLAAARRTDRVEYQAVRTLKFAALRTAFARFLDAEWRPGTARAQAFDAFCYTQSWWLDEYALFRALRAGQDERPWREWSTVLRDRHPAALDAARDVHGAEIQFRQWVQWVAETQWRTARRMTAPLRIFGDLPFMVNGDSADVWARQEQFRFDASVGAPPDEFSADGQDWSLPVYRWDVAEAGGFEWQRQRAERNANLFDGYRVDHVAGFYRTYARPLDGSEPFFTPASEAEQVALGERVLGVLRSPGSRVVAEDLGTVPDFVRASLARQSVPGYKVLRWERQWHQPGQPLADPAEYPEVAVATTGTHDTEPLAIWWLGATRAEREAVLALPSIRDRLPGGDHAAAVGSEVLTPACHMALLEALYASPAALVILPLADLFAWAGRINDPASPVGENWRWRLPWPVEHLASRPEGRAVATCLAGWARAHHR